MAWQFVGREVELASVVERIGAGESILLAGPAGVGKSRLADEVGLRLEPRHHVERLIGSPSLQQLPFGAVAHLGGEAPLPEPAALIGVITGAIRRRARGRPVVVVIDDINLVDSGSMAFIENLLTREDIPVLATVRSEAARDPRIVQLWKDRLIDRHDIGPLGRGDTHALTESILGGECTSGLRNEVWRLSEGHPLFVRQLLLEGIDQGAVARTDHLWTLAGALGGSQRVADLVEHRTNQLDENEAAGLRAIALCEPAPLTLARRITTTAILEALEAQQMIRLDTTQDGPVVRTSHPLIAEVVIARTPPLARVAATERLARVLLDAPAPGFRDSMRAAMWLLDAGELPPQQVAIDGARAALRGFDPVLARRLAEAALARGESQAATVLLGRSRAAAGDTSEAVAVLLEARRQAMSDADIAAATTALAEIHMFNIGDAALAVRELENDLASVDEPGPRAEISGHLMMAAGVTGDFDLGLRIGPEVADGRDLPEPAQLNAVMAMTLTQTMTGKLDRVLERVQRGERLAARISEYQPFATDQIGMNRLLAHQALAQFDQADVYAERSLRAGVGLPGAWLFVSAISKLFTGNLAAARRLTAEADLHLSKLDPLGLEPMARGLRAMCEAMAGQCEAARDLIDAVHKESRGTQTRVAVWADRAEAWCIALSGDASAGAGAAVVAGEVAVEGTHYVWGAYALHDAVRLGSPERATAGLRRLADARRGPLVELLADHAEAAANGDVAALVAVANRALDVGATALAAECHAAAAASLGSGHVAARHAHLARHHQGRCQGFVSPLVEAVTAPLTTRQVEIASQAAAGQTSKAIARRLHLSVRTVDNHLASVYAVLGVDGRAALTDLFPPGSPSAERPARIEP